MPAKKKITTISVVILVISLILGITVIICGVIARNNAEKEAVANQAAATARLTEIEKEQTDLDKQIEENMSTNVPTRKCHSVQKRPN